MKRKLKTLLVLLVAAIPELVSSAANLPAERATNDFVFIDNGTVRLGVKKSSRSEEHTSELQSL